MNPKKARPNQAEARRQHNQDEIKGALLALAANPNFAVFIDTLRDQRENAVAYLTSYTAIQNEREYFAAVGEVRACDTILEAYTQALQTIQEQAEAASEFRPDAA